MRTIKNALLLGGAITLAVAAQAQAASYGVSVRTGLTGGNGFTTTNSPPAFSSTPAIAAFTYTGALNFDNSAPQNNPSVPPGDLNSSFGFNTGNVSGYNGSGTVTYNGNQVANFANIGTFLASSGSVAGYGYGSYYVINLGTLVAGTNLTIRHDDGIALYRGTVQAGPSIQGPTSVVTDTFNNLQAGDYTLYYSRQNGTPSVLQVAVPEPASIALFGAGLLGLGLVRRRRDHKAG